MERILVIGSPGSGKSTFSRALAQRKQLPLVYLDRLFWNADKTTVDQAQFDQRLGEAMARTQAWILDGNYGRTLEMRLERCTQVFFLDLPVEVCLESVRARRGTVRPDMPWVETEEDPEFMEYIQTFPQQQRPKILELREKYGGSPGWCSTAGARWTPICGAWMQEWQRQKGSKGKVFAVRPRPVPGLSLRGGCTPGNSRRVAARDKSRLGQLAAARAHREASARPRRSASAVTSRLWQLASLVLIERLTHVRGGGGVLSRRSWAV